MKITNSQENNKTPSHGLTISSLTLKLLHNKSGELERQKTSKGIVAGMEGKTSLMKGKAIDRRRRKEGGAGGMLKMTHLLGNL